MNLIQGFTLTPAHFLTSHFEPLMMTSMEERGADEDYNPVKDSATWNMEKGTVGYISRNRPEVV